MEFTPVELERYANPCINLYNGRWSIVNKTKGKDDNWYMTFVYPSGYKEGANYPRDYRVPQSIYLGDSKQQALETLRTLATQLKAE